MTARSACSTSATSIRSITFERFNLAWLVGGRVSGDL
jgi:hypothetical protein